MGIRAPDRWLVIAVAALLGSLALSVTDLVGRIPSQYQPLDAGAFTRFVIDAPATGEPLDPTRAPEPSARPTSRLVPSPRPAPTQVARGVTPPLPTPPRPPVGLRSITGLASTYCCTHGIDGYYAAAGPALRIAMGGSAGADIGAPWRGRLVRVCSKLACVTVRLVDWCRCTGSGSTKLIDLEPLAMVRILPDYLIAGVVTVTVSW